MHPICAALWEAKLHTQSCTLAVCLGFLVFFFKLCPLLFDLLFISHVHFFHLSVVIFFKIYSFIYLFARGIYEALGVAFGYEMCHINKFVIHPSVYPVWFLCQWVHRLPQLDPPPPTKSTVSTRGTRTNPAVIHGHNPSCPLGTVCNPTSRLGVFLKETIFHQTKRDQQHISDHHCRKQKGK